MSDEIPNILNNMDAESIQWQNCAICDAKAQQVVQSDIRPDYALCGACGSAFVLEHGGQMRMLYGRISDEMPKTRKFALYQWRKYIEIRTHAVQERAIDNEGEDTLPDPIQNILGDSLPSTYGDHSQGILDLEAEKADIFYRRQKKLDPPPKRLRETGELPDLDELFKDNDIDPSKFS